MVQGGLPGGGSLHTALVGMGVSVRAVPSVFCGPRFPCEPPPPLQVSSECSSGSGWGHPLPTPSVWGWLVSARGLGLP